MHMKKQNQWIALFVVLLLSVTIGLGTAISVSAAETINGMDTWSLAAGETDTLTGWNTTAYGNIKNAYSSNTVVLQVTNINTSANTITVKAGNVVNASTATLTVVSQDNAGREYNMNIPIKVSAYGSNNNSYSNSSNSISLTAYGTAYTAGTHYSVTSQTSSNTSVAVVNVLPSNSSSTVIITPLAAGNATISYSYRDSAGGNLETRRISVTVSSSSGSQASIYGSSSSGSSSSTNTNDMSIEAGTSWTIGKTGSVMYYEITSANTGDSSIATVQVDGGEGNMYLRIKGVSAGTTSMRFSYRLAANGPVYTSNHNIVVSPSTKTNTSTNNSDSGSSNTNTNPYTDTSSDDDLKTLPDSSNYQDEEEGIKFGNRKDQISATVGKSYQFKSGLTLNGDSITPDELLWLTPDTSILTVNMTTGVFKAKKAGTATLIAVDLSGTYIKSVEIIAK